MLLGNRLVNFLPNPEEEEKRRVKEREARLAEEQEPVTRDTCPKEPTPSVSKVLQLDVESEVGEDTAGELRELQTEHANLVMELEKTNMLLDIQYKLKQDYQDEVTFILWEFLYLVCVSLILRKKDSCTILVTSHRSHLLIFTEY